MGQSEPQKWMTFGLSPGWQAQRRSASSVFEIAAHLAEICAMPEGINVLLSPCDVLVYVLTQG